MAWFNFFSKKPYEEIIQKELPLDKNGTVSVKSTYGDIIVKEWKQDSVQLKATKMASKEELLPEADVKIQASEKRIVIATKEKKEAEGKVEIKYELIVPETANINLIGKKGSLSINNLRATVKARTENGNIEVANVKGSTIASTDYGSITVCNSSEDVRVHTLNGNITIDEATKNIVARAKKGTICTTCKNACQLDTISLSTQSGNIEICLPEEVNAELLAKTAKGKITSEHYITMKPQTTMLNKKTWARMRKEVDGTLGNGDATIKLTSGSGNIKINKTA